jgi:glycosyltransferase involved in cell wall biosynthesis
MSEYGWIVCQVGAREHYALARALKSMNLLSELVTDVWAPPSTMLSSLPGPTGARLKGRYDPELADAHVTRFTRSFALFEASAAFRRTRGHWALTIARNNLFQYQVARHLCSTLATKRCSARVLFAYSYAARKILVEAHKAGIATVLGQIDGGLGDQNYMDTVWRRHAGISTPPERPPATYWNNWREECRLANRIVVNSTWSRDLLVNSGIPEHKIAIVPVIYSPRGNVGHLDRTYPASFTHARPLRVLFLGSLTVRKGVIESLQAASMLRSEPVEFNFVGNDDQGLAVLARGMNNVRWNSAVPRLDVGKVYRGADVFLFPTHSDGFGITQLEALDWRLPVVTSAACARVVKHNQTGLVLEEVSPQAIARALRSLIARPQLLATMSLATHEALHQFSPHRVLSRLIEIATEARSHANFGHLFS